jgi:hypothetical protein
MMPAYSKDNWISSFCLVERYTPKLTSNVGATAVGLPLRSAPQWAEPID